MGLINQIAPVSPSWLTLMNYFCRVCCQKCINVYQLSVIDWPPSTDTLQTVAFICTRGTQAEPQM